LRQQSFIGELCRVQQAFVEGAALRHKPAHPNTAFAQSGNLPRGALVRAAAKQLEDYNVGISVGDVMAEASWVDVADFPIVELQVDGDFINGCADDRGQTHCLRDGGLDSREAQSQDAGQKTSKRPPTAGRSAR
jgi:hypothetical protein